jgi:uncharacterized protein YjiS (DUF1127 family)
MSSTFTLKAGENGVTSRLVRVLKNTRNGIAEARRMHRLYEELASMTSRELKDIGISRSDIPAVVAGTFRRERATTPNSALPVVRRKRHLPAARVQLGGRKNKQTLNQISTCR